jgi:hypothetical protein
VNCYSAGSRLQASFTRTPLKLKKLKAINRGYKLKISKARLGVVLSFQKNSLGISELIRGKWSTQLFFHAKMILLPESKIKYIFLLRDIFVFY